MLTSAYNERAEPFEKGPATPFQRSPYHSALIPGTRTAYTLCRFALHLGAPAEALPIP
jgi:hypothetical protein